MAKPSGDPLLNLSAVSARMDSLHRFLSDSIATNTLLDRHRMSLVSSEIQSAIHHTIANASALIDHHYLDLDLESKSKSKTHSDQIREPSDGEIIELDSIELLAEHVHFCDICGKGFKRDANLRMHMRAHGNRFKTPQALARPLDPAPPRNARFSCPFQGCKRNKRHAKFRSLKSVICVKNHFKRSHCPKMYSCDRCRKKRFSVVADLKSHLKHCGEAKWRCSCGTSFSRKDKLFGHMALFEGHMPAVGDEEDERGADKGVEAMEEEDEGNGIFEGLLDGFGSIDNYCLQDMLGSPSCLVAGMEEFRDL